MQKIIVTGAAGMLGSLMIDYLLANTVVEVYGMVRPHSSPNLNNLSLSINNPRFNLIYGDLLDSSSMERAIKDIHPDIFFNFGCPSFVSNSWDFPSQTFNAGATGIIYILEAVKNFAPQCKFINMGSSEEFGTAKYTPQDENHPLSPSSLYGASKAAARLIIQSYVAKYSLNACQPILYNNEHHRRGESFLSTKVAKGVARISKEMKLGRGVSPIELGSLDSLRDFSASEDFVRALWLISRQYKMENYVLSSGQLRSIKEFVETAFKASGQWEGDLAWRGNDLYIGNVKVTTTNPAFYRAPEKISLCGNTEKIERQLGWKPRIGFGEMVASLVQYQINKL